MIGAAAIGQWSEAALVAFLFSLGTVLQVGHARAHPARDQRLDEARAGHGQRAACRRRRRRPERDHHRRRRPRRRRRRPRAPRRAGGGRRRRRRGLRRGRPGAGHRRVGPGRQRSGRPGLRRLHHRGRHAPRARDRGGLRHDHRQDRPHGRGGAGAARAGGDHRRPLREPLHAGRRRAGGRGGLRAAAPRRVVRHVVLPRPRPAHHQLPLRARHLDAGEHPGRAGTSDQERRADQGRRLPRADGRSQGGRLRQDGDAHPGAAPGDRRRPAERRVRGPGAPRRGGAGALQRAPAGARDHRARRSHRRGDAGSAGRRAGGRLLLLHAGLLLLGRRRCRRSRWRRTRARRARPRGARRRLLAPPSGHERAEHGPDVERFRAIPGRGVRAELDGRLHFVGRPDLLGDHAADPALVRPRRRPRAPGQDGRRRRRRGRGARRDRRQRPAAARRPRGDRRAARARRSQRSRC